MKTLAATRYAGIALAGCALALLMARPLYREPIGFFDAHPILGYHDTGDVLEFRTGGVTYHTWCGSSPLGSFGKDAGRWVWRVPGSRWMLNPGPFAVTCTDLDLPTNRFVLIRRFWRPARVGYRIQPDEEIAEQ